MHPQRAGPLVLPIPLLGKGLSTPPHSQFLTRFRWIPSPDPRPHGVIPVFGVLIICLLLCEETYLRFSLANSEESSRLFLTHSTYLLGHSARDSLTHSTYSLGHSVRDSPRGIPTMIPSGSIASLPNINKFGLHCVDCCLEHLYAITKTGRYSS